VKDACSFLKTALACCVLALAAANAAAAYPEKPIRLIVPYPPGGLTDAVARQVANSLAERVRQPVVIENVPGGGGNIGADKAAKSPADGYTLYIGNNATVGINTLIYKKLPFNPIKDLAPVSLIAESQTVLVVHPSLPVKSVAELIALARSKPGQLNFGSTGTGGLSHLASEMLKSAAGVQMTHVPYKGTGPALNDLLGGQIQLMFNDTVIPHIKAEKLRALAVTGTRRWKELPEVPTLAELGVPGYETYNWFGILAPRGNARGHRRPAEPGTGRRHEGSGHAGLDAIARRRSGEQQRRGVCRLHQARPGEMVAPGEGSRHHGRVKR
jgi:tripartite-type tricarboxylate transporter receptor subunit TctC